MSRALFIAIALAVSACSSSAPEQAAPTSTATIFEAARLIVGDGQTIDNGAFVVDGGRLTQVGRAEVFRRLRGRDGSILPGRR